MPVRYLSDAELARLSGWPEEIADEDAVTSWPTPARPMPPDASRSDSAPMQQHERRPAVGAARGLETPDAAPAPPPPPSRPGTPPGRPPRGGRSPLPPGRRALLASTIMSWFRLLSRKKNNSGCVVAAAVKALDRRGRAEAATEAAWRM